MAAAPSVAAIRNPVLNTHESMNDHHFSYPVVVPLGALTISGHSTRRRRSAARSRSTPSPPPQSAQLSLSDGVGPARQHRSRPRRDATRSRRARRVHLRAARRARRHFAARRRRASDAEWQNHLAYLRDLQRVGREALARAASAERRSSVSRPIAGCRRAATPRGRFTGCRAVSAVSIRRRRPARAEGRATPAGGG